MYFLACNADCFLQNSKGEYKMSFPKLLDNASILYHTPENCFGEIYYTTGEPAEQIRYLAIYKYENDTSYYLFGCNADQEKESIIQKVVLFCFCLKTF